MCITTCNSSDVSPIDVIQVFWRRRSMVLAIITIASLPLVAVRMVSIFFVELIFSLPSTFVEGVDVDILEMRTTNAYRRISVRRVDLHLRCAIRDVLVRRLPRPSFRRRRGMGWSRCTLLLGIPSVAVPTGCTRHA